MLDGRPGAAVLREVGLGRRAWDEGRFALKTPDETHCPRLDMDEEFEQLMVVLQDARLEADAAAIARLGAAVASLLGVAQVGADAYGIWLDVGGELLAGCARMRWISPGRYLRGSPKDEAGRFGWEGPQHSVVLTAGLWLGETPVTQALYEAVMGSNPSRFKSPLRPVEQVSWHDAVSFCERLGERLGGLKPHLPTEAQWEYAARAGTTTATYAGELEALGENNVPVLDAIAWYSGNSGVGFELDNGYDSSVWEDKQHEHSRAGTHPVAQKQPNAWGLYDMLGDVHEWCQDATSMSSYEADEQLDPLGTTGPERVIRGGSFCDNARIVRAASRFALEPGDRYDYLGFRLAGGPAPRSGADEAQDGPVRTGSTGTEESSPTGGGRPQS